MDFLFFQADPIVLKDHRTVLFQKNINTPGITFVDIMKCGNSIYTILQQLPDKGIRVTINMF